MMGEAWVLGLVALAASLLTFFSGFGLGTLLLAFMLLYFPPTLAIALTAVVHLANNLFKWLLTRHHMDLPLVIRFGLPAIAGALCGSFLLRYLQNVAPIAGYTLGEQFHQITAIKLVVGGVMILFVLWEWIPALSHIKFDEKKMLAGGFITGFFGGLSGHQGALRSAFLAKGKLEKETFVATGVAIACLIDVSRIQSYFRQLQTTDLQTHSTLLITCILAALAGSVMGNMGLKKVTDTFVQNLVAVMVMIMAILLITGIL